MKVTKVDIRKMLYNDDSPLKAIASVTIDDNIAIHDCRVIESDHLFVAFPSRKDEKNIYRDVVHPINPQARMLIEGAILKAYAEKVSKSA